MAITVAWIKGPASVLAALYAIQEGEVDCIHVADGLADSKFLFAISHLFPLKSVAFDFSQIVDCTRDAREIVSWRKEITNTWFAKRADILKREGYKWETLGLCSEEQAKFRDFRLTTDVSGPHLHAPLIENGITFPAVLKWFESAKIDVSSYKEKVLCL